ncbi:MAG: hypothetical protein ACTSWM_03470 [Alphaproteobacteria bacterium]
MTTMFGLGKKKHMHQFSVDAGTNLRNVLAFPRHVNDGQIPESLKNDNYVLGYHFGLALNLYLKFAKGQNEAAEQGFFLMNALAIALEVDAREVGNRLEPLMENPDSKFKLGFDHAQSAFTKMEIGDNTAFKEFNESIRGRY